VLLDFRPVTSNLIVWSRDAVAETVPFLTVDLNAVLAETCQVRLAVGPLPEPGRDSAVGVMRVA